VPEQQPVPDEAVEAALAVAHEGPMSLCDMGSDTCATRPEVRRLVEAAASFIRAQVITELRDAASDQGPQSAYWLAADYLERK
jgi:hypothetical protein